MCPVQALDAYIHRAALRRKGDKLLVCYGPPKTKQTLSRWILDAINIYFESSQLPSPIGVRAHSTRSMAAFKAFLAGVPIQDIPIQTGQGLGSLAAWASWSPKCLTGRSSSSWNCNPGSLKEQEAASWCHTSCIPDSVLLHSLKLMPAALHVLLYQLVIMSPCLLRLAHHLNWLHRIFSIVNESLAASVAPTSLSLCLRTINPLAWMTIVQLPQNHICSSTPVTLDPLHCPNRSKDDAISQILHYSLTHIDSKNGNYVRLLFIDYSSAFNTIVPIKLVFKLTDLCLNSSLCDWIQDFLTGRPQVVKVGQFTSNSITLNVGAPQSCVLSPLLYSLYTHSCVSSHSSTSIIRCPCGSVVEHYVSSAKGCGFNSQGTHILTCTGCIVSRFG